jgi:hypothetical protein
VQRYLARVAMRRGVSRAFLLINHVSVSHLIPSSPSLPFLSHSLNFSVPLSSPLSFYLVSHLLLTHPVFVVVSVSMSASVSVCPTD